MSMEILSADRSKGPAELRTAFFGSRFGTALIALEPETERIAWLSLVLDTSSKAMRLNLAELEEHWEPESLKECDLKQYLQQKPGDWIFENNQPTIPLLMRGTPFQHEVWNALRKIPTGETRSYAEVAEMLGRPGTHARAVGSAIAKNTIAVLVPCHRVVRSGGEVKKFRWGITRKRMLLEWEQAALNNVV